jgi:hypothetical protein
MSNTVKFEVSISLDDFFNSEAERSAVFRDALEQAIVSKLNEHEFVQKNIAYYLFHKFTDDIFVGEFDKIKSAVKERIEEFKEPDSWAVQNHDRFKKAMNEAFDELHDTIKEAAHKKATEFTNDEGRDYNSFYGKVSDAMVDRVFNHFVDAMVKKESERYK